MIIIPIDEYITDMQLKAKVSDGFQFYASSILGRIKNLEFVPDSVICLLDIYIGWDQVPSDWFYVHLVGKYRMFNNSRNRIILFSNSTDAILFKLSFDHIL